MCDGQDDCNDGHETDEQNCSSTELAFTSTMTPVNVSFSIVVKLLHSIPRELRNLKMKILRWMMMAKICINNSVLLDYRLHI